MLRRTELEPIDFVSLEELFHGARRIACASLCSDTVSEKLSTFGPSALSSISQLYQAGEGSAPPPFSFSCFACACWYR